MKPTFIPNSKIQLIVLVIIMTSLTGANAIEVPFSSIQTIATGFSGASAAVSVDLDRDGDLDVLGCTEGTATGVIWWENTSGDGSAWTADVIDGDFDCRQIIAADLDSDGDLDAVGAAWGNGQGGVTWWENTAGDGSVWAEHGIDTGFSGAFPVAVGDFDADGDLDVVAGNGGMTWWANDGTPADGGWWAYAVAGATGVTGIAVADLDADGHLDLATAGGAGGNSVVWWQSDGAATPTFTRYTVNSAFTGAHQVDTGDANGDGRLDILATAEDDGEISWFDRTGPGLHDWTEHSVTTAVPVTQWARFADLDQDGDADVLGTGRSDGEVSWFENTDGLGTAWTERNMHSGWGNARSIEAADLDDDGDLDLLAAAITAGQIAWWENQTLHRSATYPTKNIVATLFNGFEDAIAADLDGDGDVDILGASDADDIRWWDNTAGDGSTWTERTIAASFDGAASVYAADMDGDGDLDVLGAANTADDIAWWENTAGDGSAWTEHIVDGSFQLAREVLAIDMDSDGDLDVVGAGGVNLIAWWENDGTSCSPACLWPVTTVPTDISLPIGVSAIDLDGDGDPDLLPAMTVNPELVWFENTAGDGSAWTEQSVATDFEAPRSIYVADIDGDGDLDIVASASQTHELAWFENAAGDATTWTEQSITEIFYGGGSVFATDLDGDGDVDIVGASNGGNSFLWWENQDGAGSTWMQRSIAEDLDAQSVYVADVNGDGDIDILGSVNVDGEIVWWENQGGQFALPTTDAVVSATPNENTSDVLVLQIDAAHRGRTGDGDLELVTFELLFEEAPADPLTDGELGALADAVRIYLDDGDGNFETDGSDINFYTAGPTFSLAAGVLTAAFVDGESDVQVAQGTDNTYFVALDLAAAAGSAVPNTVIVTHVTESSSTGEMTSTDLPLTLEYHADTNSTAMTVQQAPNITVDPTSLAFGSQEVAAGATATQLLTITNDGSADLNFSSISLVGDDAAEFNIFSDSGEAIVIPTETRTVTVNCDPSSIGAKSASLRILSDDADEATVDVGLSCTGIAPEITVTPASLSFGARVTTDGPTSTQTVTITNDGSAGLNISSVALVGADAGEFNITGDSGETNILPASSRTVTLTFDPNSVGAKSADLRIVSDDADEATVDIGLSGEGVNAGDVVFFDGFEIGDVSLWSSSAP